MLLKYKLNINPATFNGAVYSKHIEDTTNMPTKEWPIYGRPNSEAVFYKLFIKALGARQFTGTE
jgi:hypothetical protein